jgi:hypothetical protein
LLLAVLSLATGAGSATHAGATSNPLDVTRTVTQRPVLTGAVCTGETQGSLIVVGEQFMPGAEVDVVLFELGNPHPVLIGATRASFSITGRNGSTDPALGFQPGGIVGIALGFWCQQPGMAQAYDRQAATWTNQLHVNLGCDASRENAEVRKGGCCME